MSDIDSVINASLLTNPEYLQKIIHHLKIEYFQDISKRTIFESIKTHYDEYNKSPSETELKTNIASLRGTVSDGVLQSALEQVEEFKKMKVDSFDWLIDSTEKFCKDRAVYNAIMKSVQILDGKVKGMTRESMPDILREALAVSFDNKVGHDYFEDAAERWRFYHEDVERIPFHLHYFNLITNGGLPRKTLTIAVAGTNVGKSAFMCDLGANYLREGHNVLYITLEMAEERISERIDANILETPITKLKDLQESFFTNQILKLKHSTVGRLIVKEYPTKSAGVTQFNALMRELKAKKDFVPDVVIIDYLNICAANKVPGDASLYVYAKAVAEDLRAFAMFHNVAVITATQTNRQGQNNSDLTLEEVGESHGISQTADLIFALIRTDDLRERQVVMVKQLKNRLANVDYYNKFVIGVDMERMTFYDTDDTLDGGSQREPDRPVFDDTRASGGLDFGAGGFTL